SPEYSPGACAIAPTLPRTVRRRVSPTRDRRGRGVGCQGSLATPAQPNAGSRVARTQLFPAGEPGALFAAAREPPVYRVGRCVLSGEANRASPRASLRFAGDHGLQGDGGGAGKRLSVHEPVQRNVQAAL